MCYLHSRSPPVIHGDLHDVSHCSLTRSKLRLNICLGQRNVLVTSAGETLICDFGLSRIRHEVPRTNTSSRQGGDPRFVAPELSSGTELFRSNEASDVYSLAMTIYTLGTGLKPFHHFKHWLPALQAAQSGKRPSKFVSSGSRLPLVSDIDVHEGAQDILCMGGLTAAASHYIWALLIPMWHHDPSSRPSVPAVRKEMALHGLIPQLLSPPQPPSDSQSGRARAAVATSDSPGTSAIKSIGGTTHVEDATVSEYLIVDSLFGFEVRTCVQATGLCLGYCFCPFLIIRQILS